MKKRDKKKFKRQDINIGNMDVTDLDDFIDEEVIHQRKAEKKLQIKGKKSQKSDLNLVKGRVIEIFSNYKCLVRYNDDDIVCHISGRLKHLSLETRNIIAVGDWVKVELDSGNRIEEIIERKNTLVRYSEDNFQKKIVIAANIDNVIIMSSCHEPELNLGMIDRLICATRLCGIRPIVCINKIDLAKNDSCYQKKAEFYRKNNICLVFCSASQGTGVSDLKNILKNSDSVFVGHSGVGKSSLINLLQPGLDLKVAQTSENTRKGIHTTTRSKIIAWEFGGNLIDTPGIKTLTLNEASKDDIKYVFPGINELAGKCQFQNCNHIHEDNCAIREAVENGKFDSQRYQSYLRIMDSFTGVVYE